MSHYPEPAIPAGGFVLGAVGTYKECIKFLIQTMEDWSDIKELVGFSSSPSFLWAMNAEHNRFDHYNYKNRVLFGYPHDIVNENIDIIWVKIHFKDKVAE